MRITVRTPAELQAESSRSNNIWPRGNYDFEVMAAEEKVSKSGNEMIELRLRVYDAAGNSQTIWDYLLDNIAYKIAHACETMGLADQYAVGELHAEDFIGKTGKLVLYIRKAENGYAEKNAVADYVNSKATATRSGPDPRKPIPAGGGTDLADEIPFGPCWQ